jgi:hypothetical protein
MSCRDQEVYVWGSLSTLQAREGGPGLSLAPSSILQRLFLELNEGEGAEDQEWVSNRCNDVLGLKSDVLDPSSSVIVHIFLREVNKETTVICHPHPCPCKSHQPSSPARVGLTWIWDFFLPGAGSLMGILMDSS